MTAQTGAPRKPGSTTPLASQEGATAIEFAIVLPLLLLLVFGITEFCILIYESSTLEGALNSASRLGRTGYPDITDAGNPGGTRWNAVLSTMQTQTSGLLNPSKIQLDATAYLNFSSVGQQGQGVAQSLGGGNDVVVYTASYPYPPMFFLQSFVGKSPMITVTDIVKNEPFNVAPPTTPCKLPPAECPGGAPPTPTPTPTAAPTPTPTPTPSGNGGGHSNSGSSGGGHNGNGGNGNGGGHNGSGGGSGSSSGGSSSSGPNPGSSSGSSSSGSSGSSGGGGPPCSPVC